MDFVSRWARAYVTVVLALGLLILPVVAIGQGIDSSAVWTTPRTVDGQPDLQGVWANNSATPLERPSEWVGRDRLTEEELANLRLAALEATDGGQDALFADQLVLAAIAGQKGESYDPTTGNYNQFWIAERDFGSQTSLVIDPPDGHVPDMTQEAQERMQVQLTYTRDHPADSWEDRPLSERCITFGVPNLLAGYNSYYQIIQGHDHVVILMEMIHDARVIPLDNRPHLPGDIRQWHGDSRGHWDGDTLVIETINFSSKSDLRGSSGNLHLTERFTRISPDTLKYELMIADPKTWTQPWTLSIPLKSSEDAIYEYACHEGNYGMEGILAGHRAEEVAEAAISGGP